MLSRPDNTLKPTPLIKVGVWGVTRNPPLPAGRGAGLGTEVNNGAIVTKVAELVKPANQ